MGFIRQLDDGALWLAAVVAGLGALGWLGRKTWHCYRAVKPWVEKGKAVLELAEYELQHNGGGSIKDSVAKIPAIRSDLVALSEAGHALAAQLTAHVAQAASIHDEQAAAIAHLAEAMPIVARSTPHADDVMDEAAVGP